MLLTLRLKLIFVCKSSAKHMSQTNKLKIFNDPIYGFITIPDSIIFDLIEHPYFQRLRRISQMGLSNLVYPGAHHTRFHHALGCMHLMQKAINVLRTKGISINHKEEQALYIAILLHDIGHGPFSHALEGFFTPGISHEDWSLAYMKKLNKEFDGKLDLAIQIFTKTHPRNFFHQLISGQLDMDRLDYLKRDSFYTGVVEGSINSDRLIAMLNVVDDDLVIDKKGIYSIEKFLLSRRFMYWQVYLHKTGLLAEKILLKLLNRARELLKKGQLTLPQQANLIDFLKDKTYQKEDLDKYVEAYTQLDDHDVWTAIKTWQDHPDKILSELSQMILNRKLLRIEMSDKAFDTEYVAKIKQKTLDFKQVSEEEVSYFFFQGTAKNRAYNKEQEAIKVLLKNGQVTEWTNIDEQFTSVALLQTQKKYYLCYPKRILNMPERTNAD